MSTEDGTRVPTLPIGTEEQKRKVLADEGRGYVSIEEELGAHILDYELEFDGDKFVGLKKKNS